MTSSLGSLLSYPFTFFWDKLNPKVEDPFERPKLEEFVSNNSVKEKKRYAGYVTSLNEGEGVIDNNIFFSNDPLSFVKFKVGDHVQGEAVRHNEQSAWRVVKILPFTENWEDGEESSEALSNECVIPSEEIPKMVIGKVVALHLDTIALNIQVNFFKNEENCKFIVVVGDWVQCERDETRAIEHGTYSATKISPLRAKTIHGRVTRAEFHHYIINGEVYCDKSLLKRRLRMGEEVVAEVMESTQRGLNWRVTNIRMDQSPKRDATQVLDLSKLIGIKVNPHAPPAQALVPSPGASKEALENPIGIEGKEEISLRGVGYTGYLTLTIKNVDSRIQYLERVRFEGEESHWRVDTSLRFPVPLSPRSGVPITFLCEGKALGTRVETLVLHFLNVDRVFQVRRSLRVTVLPSLPNRTGNRGVNAPPSEGRIIPGEKPFRASPFLPVKLPQAPVPSGLWGAVLGGEDPRGVEPSLGEELCPQNYEERFSALLHLEEIEMELQMRKFDIPCSTFTPHGEFLSLHVEGLSEKRPSLMVGDSVLAAPPYGTPGDGIRHEGIIHQVLHSKVLLKFHSSFHADFCGEDYSLQLCFNRTPLRRCHLAVRLAMSQLGPSILFPSNFKCQIPQACFVDTECQPTKRGNVGLSFPEGKKEGGALGVDSEGRSGSVPRPRRQRAADPLPLHWHNPSLNLEQRTAVKRVLEGATRPLPYVIFGPPGTGKTVTLVEAILQIYKLVPHSRILAVSGSNSASDLVAERAIVSGRLGTGELVRMNAFNRSSDNISTTLFPYCVTGDDLAMVVRHRIIVSTAMSAGLLYTAKLRNGHFTHVFVDEAGQLTEPEACIPLGLVNSVSGQIVLAGDPKQLGPVVMSRLAKKMGLHSSLLHRLCSSVLYLPDDPFLKTVYDQHSPSTSSGDESEASAKCQFEPRLVTLLVRNYRSHPDLLRVPSDLFYHSLLVAASSHQNTESLLGWPELPNPSCPLLFHSIQGENLQEGDSPSWFNPAEAFQVARYTMSLLEYGLEPADIGIVAPYKKQVEKIRQLLSAFGVGEDVKVGPVEEFQGQERQAILVSTVRSTESLVQSDITHHLGFVRCAQRFNVAITRAIALLIVIGNPILLSVDGNWKIFLEYCVEKGVVKT